MEKFFRLTPSIAQKLINLKLTANEYRVFMYLVTKFPYGDKYNKIESHEIMEQCDISQSTLYRIFATLKEHELFDFQDRGIDCRNLVGAKAKAGVAEPKQASFPELGNISQNCEKILRTEDKFSELGKNSQNWENESPEPLHSADSNSPKTIKTSKTSSDPSDQDEGKTNDEGIMNNEEAHDERNKRSHPDHEIYLALEDEEFVNFIYEQNPSIRNPIAYLKFTPEGANKNNFRLYHDLYTKKQRSSSTRLTEEEIQKWARTSKRDEKWLSFPLKDKWLQSAISLGDPYEFIENGDKNYPRKLRQAFLHAMKYFEQYRTKHCF